MKKEVCFRCDSEDVKVIESENMRIFQCQGCWNKWGKFFCKE